MPNYSFMPENHDVSSDPLKAKEKRAQDAEKIRQDFVRSRRLPGGPPQQPQPEANEDEC